MTNQTMTRAERALMWSSILLGVAWILYRLLNNTGWILDDEITHYIFSASVWENSDQVFNHWTRPGRNLLHCLAAPFGFTATRLFTLGLALLSVFFTYKVGEILKVKMLWTVPLMLMFQSWFPELSYPVLTQTPFMLLWILGVWLGLTKRWHLAGFCFGYLSLIRHEGILLTAIWGMWVTFSAGGFGNHLVGVFTRKNSFEGIMPKLGRDALYGVSTVSAILLYNLAAYLFNNGAIPFKIYFESEPTTMYGSGTLFHYALPLLGGVGLFSMILTGFGIFTLRGHLKEWSLILITYPTYLILHVLIYWKGAYASGGYYHFLMPMAPFFALVAAQGLGFISERIKKGRRALTYAAVGLVVYQGINMAHHQVVYQDWAAIHKGHKKESYSVFAKPMEKGVLSSNIVEASQWVNENMPEASPVLAKHIAHNFTQGNIMTPERQADENAALYQMPIGTVYIWDYQYCQQENRLKFESFNESQDWEIVKLYPKRYPDEGATEMKDTHSVVIFHKVSKLDTQDKQYDELGEADKYNASYSK